MWIVEVDDEVWALDTVGLPEVERREIRDTVESWTVTGPPATTGARRVGTWIWHEFEMANGLVIKFATEEDGLGGGLVVVTRVVLRYWFPS